jgi:4-hydroxythreonine-4-phosphate dehydrogenase
LQDVAAAITRDELDTTLRILHADLMRNKFGIAAPRILVAGLNPHAGEGGHMGREEIEVIAPVLDACAPKAWTWSARCRPTRCSRNVLAGSDAQLAMYHDQGLAVLKYAAFDEGINVTLGLPVIRTSVDHGTALDLAGTGRPRRPACLPRIDAAIGMAQRSGEQLTCVSCWA